MPAKWPAQPERPHAPGFEDRSRIRRGRRVLGDDDHRVPVLERHAERGRRGDRHGRVVRRTAVEERVEQGDPPGVLTAFRLHHPRPSSRYGGVRPRGTSHD
ncbi:hypothetical protein OG711_00735 [Streptomyces uncialis]|uniref:hypothetical protein n=1 Tax=Streptomyces uncialis TaxID=1048205 RepID=UPI002E31B5F1|nr:hypothetical protein [Streptomyces uncialis]